MYSDWDHGFYVAIIGQRYGRAIRHRCPRSWQGGQGERGGQVEMLCQGICVVWQWAVPHCGWSSLGKVAF